MTTSCATSISRSDHRADLLNHSLAIRSFAYTTICTKITATNLSGPTFLSTSSPILLSAARSSGESVLRRRVQVKSRLDQHDPKELQALGRGGFPDSRGFTPCSSGEIDSARPSE